MFSPLALITRFLGVRRRGRGKTETWDSPLVYLLAHNIPAHTKLSIVIYLYIQLSIVYCYSLFTCSFYLLFLLCVFVLSLSFCCTAVTYVTKTNSYLIYLSVCVCVCVCIFRLLSIVHLRSLSQNTVSKHSKYNHRLLQCN